METFQNEIATPAAPQIIALNAGNSTQLLSSDAPLLLDFWAPWCAPCRALEPLLKQIGQRFGGTVAIAKVNVDLQPDLAQRFQVRSIPTLVLFKGQREVLRLAAAECSAEHIVTELGRNL